MSRRLNFMSIASKRAAVIAHIGNHRMRNIAVFSVHYVPGCLSLWSGMLRFTRNVHSTAARLCYLVLLSWGSGIEGGTTFVYSLSTTHEFNPDCVQRKSLEPKMETLAPPIVVSDANSNSTIARTTGRPHPIAKRRSL
jgi:hypothetical protein